MTCIVVQCPPCHSEQMVKRGKTDRGTQRYLGQNTACVTGSFRLDYHNRGCVPEVKHQIVDMTMNASGIRDTARVLHMSPNTVLYELGIAPCGRTLKHQPRAQGAVRCALDAYVPRLITCPSSSITP